MFSEVGSDPGADTVATGEAAGSTPGIVPLFGVNVALEAPAGAEGGTVAPTFASPKLPVSVREAPPNVPVAAALDGPAETGGRARALLFAPVFAPTESQGETKLPALVDAGGTVFDPVSSE